MPSYSWATVWISRSTLLPFWGTLLCIVRLARDSCFLYLLWSVSWAGRLPSCGCVSMKFAPPRLHSVLSGFSSKNTILLIVYTEGFCFVDGNSRTEWACCMCSLQMNISLRTVRSLAAWRWCLCSISREPYLVCCVSVIISSGCAVWRERRQHQFYLTLFLLFSPGASEALGLGLGYLAAMGRGICVVDILTERHYYVDVCPMIAWTDFLLSLRHIHN